MDANRLPRFIRETWHEWEFTPSISGENATHKPTGMVISIDDCFHSVELVKPFHLRLPTRRASWALDYAKRRQVAALVEKHKTNGSKDDAD